ncbi:MAG TPA: hypothetical protein VEU72_00880 [Nitrosopumilaceae archaeon]|nr:hypothetical protein [Nitrosopumilaceae archaeon]
MVERILVLPMVVVLAFAVSFSVHQAYADGSITLSSSSNPCCRITISGNGFIAEEGQPVFVFSDGTQIDTVTVANDGTILITVGVTSGTHTISIFKSNSPSDTLLATAQITVPPPISIPEFPFSFSLVIIFVAISAVYLSIRQKMIPGFKSF